MKRRKTAATKRRTVRKSRQAAGVRAKAAKPLRRRSNKERRRAAGAKGHYSQAVRGVQQAAASLDDRDVIEILAELPWQQRAKWLSSYFTSQIPETDERDQEEEEIAQSVDSLGAQVAALLDAMDAEDPQDFLHAVTCCFSADPSHVEAGASWLEENLGSRAIDLDALEDLPGYRAVAEIIDQVRSAGAG